MLTVKWSTRRQAKDSGRKLAGIFGAHAAARPA
jgi:hypothetical protein